MNTAKYNWARGVKAEIHRHSDEEIKRANQIIECPNCGIGWGAKILSATIVGKNTSEPMLEGGGMNNSQEAVLNRFPRGRFEVFTRSGRVPRLDSKRAKRILRQFQGSILFIKSTGEERDGQNQTEVPRQV